MLTVSFFQLKPYTLDEALHLLKRYNKHGGVASEFNQHCRDYKVWRHSEKLLCYIADNFISRVIRTPASVSCDTTMTELIEEWAIVHQNSDEEDLKKMILKCILNAGSSKCMYPFCLYLIKKVSNLSHLDKSRVDRMSPTSCFKAHLTTSRRTVMKRAA